MPPVLVLEDRWTLSATLRNLCAFLEIQVEQLDSDEPLLPFLQRCRPMAVTAPIEAAGQDGAHVLMTVARYDRGLPVLLLNDGGAALAGVPPTRSSTCGGCHACYGPPAADTGWPR
jgi:hypothetical protein